MSGDWRAGLPDVQLDGGRALLCCQQKFLVHSNGSLFSREWLKRQELPALTEVGLGYLDDQPVYLLLLEEAVRLPGCVWYGLRQLLLQGANPECRLLSFASQIASWVEQHRFCGRCGARMLACAAERLMQCGKCGLQNFPRLSPSMIVLLSRGDELLLARSPTFPPGLYSTLAGFVEPGESLEQCVVREVHEEVGLEICDLQYMASQSWPFPHSLMLGFHARYAGGEIVPQAGEIEDARWFLLDQLPKLPPAQTISRYLIELFLSRRSGLPEPLLPN